MVRPNVPPASKNGNWDVTGDTSALALGLPLILLLLFGFAVSLDVNKINFAIQDLEITPTGREYMPPLAHQPVQVGCYWTRSQRASTARSGELQQV